MSRAGQGARPSVDVVDFTRGRRTAEGTLAAGNLERLRDIVLDRQVPVAWTMTGREVPTAVGPPERYLDLEVHARVRVACVRCLGPVEIVVSEARTFRVVDSEETAARLDSPDLDYDVLSAGTRLDVASLVEDEMILALPALPRHDEACKLPPGADGDREMPGESAPQRPFAGLSALRRSGEGH